MLSVTRPVRAADVNDIIRNPTFSFATATFFVVIPILTWLANVMAASAVVRQVLLRRDAREVNERLKQWRSMLRMLYVFELILLWYSISLAVTYPIIPGETPVCNATRWSGDGYACFGNSTGCELIGSAYIRSY